MHEALSHRFRKNERIVSKKLLDTLFGGGGRSLTVYPLRVVYMEMDTTEGASPVSILVSVSKRHFKRAVKRNRCKRLVREAYRLNKHMLQGALETKPDKSLAMAFIWMSDEVKDFATVEGAMKSLLGRVAEKL